MVRINENEREDGYSLIVGGISIKDYVDLKIGSVIQMLEANRELSENKFKLSQIAIDKAEEAQQLRNEGANEWRQESKDRQLNFPSKDDLKSLKSELGSAIDRNASDIKDLQLSRATLAGKASQQSVNIAFIISAIGVVLGVASFVLKISGNGN